MQYRIFEKGRLLNEYGQLIERGYSTKMLREYNREHIKAPRWRIKEWDYYYFGNDSYGVALTIADNSYMALVSATLLDFQKPNQITKSIIKPFTNGSLKLPSTSKIGDVGFENKQIKIRFENDGKCRRLFCEFDRFSGSDALFCDITLRNEPDESMVIATPFKNKPKHFYYNQKINCMTAEGIVRLGKEQIVFSPNDSFGVLDWGRGVWTYSNTWYWGSASGLVDGTPFGFNLGYGFGDTSEATENMIFYDNKAHKLENVSFEIPLYKSSKKPYFMAKWKITSSDKRLEMTFRPIIDRYANMNALILKSNQHQVFGRFDGHVILDNAKLVSFENLLGFAERVQNRW